MRILDTASGIIWAFFSYCDLVRSCFVSVYFCSFSVMVLWRLWQLGIGTFVDYTPLMVLLCTIMSGLLLWIVW